MVCNYSTNLCWQMQAFLTTQYALNRNVMLWGRTHPGWFVSQASFATNDDIGSVAVRFEKCHGNDIANKWRNCEMGSLYTKNQRRLSFGSRPQCVRLFRLSLRLSVISTISLGCRIHRELVLGTHSSGTQSLYKHVRIHRSERKTDRLFIYEHAFGRVRRTVTTHFRITRYGRV